MQQYLWHQVSGNFTLFIVAVNEYVELITKFEVFRAIFIRKQNIFIALLIAQIKAYCGVT